MIRARSSGMSLTAATAIHWAPSRRSQGTPSLFGRFSEACEEVQAGEPNGAAKNKISVKGRAITLKRAQHHMQHQQAIGHIDGHVHRFPNPGFEIGEPKIMRRGSHDERDQQGDKAE